MKNVLFLLFFSTSLFSQTFVNTENQWVTLIEGAFHDSPIGGTIIHALGNQVSIDGIDYLQLQQLDGYPDETDDFPEIDAIYDLDIFFREDAEGRVYRKMGSNPEVLFYDFSLEIGDGFGNMTLIFKDSILLDNGEKREVFEFDNEVIWIKGIGEINSNGTKNLQDNSVDQFICFYQNESMIHKFFEEEFCFFLLVNDEEVFTNELKIYPNPVANLLTINSTKSIENISICDFSGRKLLETDENQINLGGLTNGVYVLKIKDTFGKEYHQRIIKK